VQKNQAAQESPQEYGKTLLATLGGQPG